MEYSIQEVAKAAGTTSRTLRHYDSIRLVSPSRIGENGYRYYNNESLVRLQRVLLLRQLGLSLESIRDVLDAQDQDGVGQAQILSDHLEFLRSEQSRLSAQIRSVERTIAALSPKARSKEVNLMTEEIFDGFDHTQYRDEVEERWGKSAYAQSDKWWRGLGKEQQSEWMTRVKELNQDWIDAAQSGEAPSSSVAQELAKRHVEWLSSMPGTPAHGGGNIDAYVLGLGEMYVADQRFAANYGGVEGATFVRDALRHFVGQG